MFKLELKFYRHTKDRQKARGGGGGYSPIKVMGVLVLPFRGLICGLVSLSVLKPKMTATRVDTLCEDKDL